MLECMCVCVKHHSLAKYMTYIVTQYTQFKPKLTLQCSGLYIGNIFKNKN